MSDPIARLDGALGDRYRVLEALGSGGMATVYRAEQQEPVRRVVAIKVLPEGDATEEILTRFASERQALAVMDHPGIAKVFDAGVTADGRPYFVMELVEGTRITDFCDEHRLGIAERLRIFRDVCAAIQHAHQKGVIHRDLKPSNVLVTAGDGRSAPRIIDFGIARAVDRGDEDGEHLTRSDQIIGTPAYMSPEQISGSSDVDTRTDVYSLGILLYQLLVGELPYDPSAYRGWAALAAHLHGEPPTPTHRFASLAETQVTLAELRGTVPADLRRELAGDLSWIVMRAMARERDERYETAHALALDLERYLAHEPVRARGATAAYVLRKFVRRNRAGVAFASTAVVGLVAFSVATSVQAERVARARDEAEARRGQAENLIDFMLGDLRDKLEPVGRLDLLDDVGREAMEYFASLPSDQFSDTELLSRSQALYQVGSVRLDEGRLAEAETAFAESLRLARALTERAPEDPERLFGESQSHFWVGYAAWLQDDFVTAEPAFQEYMRLAEALVEMDGTNTDWRLELMYATSNLGSVREAVGDLDGALEVLRTALAIQADLADSDPAEPSLRLDLARSHNKVGVILEKLGRFEEAQREYEADLAISSRLAATDPSNAIWREAEALSHVYSGLLHRIRGEPDDALRAFRRHEEIFAGLVALDPANTNWRNSLGVARRNVGLGLLQRSDHAGAGVALESSRAIFEELVRQDPERVNFRLGLAEAHLAVGRLALATDRPESAASEAAEATALLEGPGAAAGDPERRDLLLGESRLLAGDAASRLGRDDAARSAWLQALDAVGSGVTVDAPANRLDLRARALMRMGRFAEARPIVEALSALGYRAPEFIEAVRTYGP